jgi:hypothetical protein
MQTRLGSAIETIISTTIGYSVSLVANILILPLFGYTPTFGAANAIAVVFTFISLIRGYFVRRLFVYLHKTNVIR